MHYSAYAFSKNGNPTITPLENGTMIGQREGLSEKDIKKIRTMYGCFKCGDEENCGEEGEDKSDGE
ncbi:Zinc metalloproteinase nas-13 [Zootermopsis nevadensis]|uniref:Zinc metalloproteinase nas-13 n=1 Tax=Zootermopsis nevadensis TaxID=136037 RepID=A0A067QYN1_ZOONE|nr:Zinc metalloproteinase nas-13 [Zootermopsis nevadensis]